MKTFCLAVFLLIIDQLTKYLADTFVAYGSNLKVIPFMNFFNITNVHNTGWLSVCSGKNNLFAILMILFLSGVLIWVFKNKAKLTALQKYAFALLISGGIGNLIDRIFRGAVVDFLDFGINTLRWPSVNIADSCVCIAAGLVFLDIFMPVFKKNKV